MDALQFEKQAKADPELSALLHAVTEEVSAQMAFEEPQRFVVGADAALLSFVTFALFRWTQDYLNNIRANREMDLAERQAKLIGILKEEGLPPKEAATVTASLLKQIADRAKDDSLMKKALDLLGSGK